jgi:hypothetical protein
VSTKKLFAGLISDGRRRSEIYPRPFIFEPSRSNFQFSLFSSPTASEQFYKCRFAVFFFLLDSRNRLKLTQCDEGYWLQHCTPRPTPRSDLLGQILRPFHAMKAAPDYEGFSMGLLLSPGIIYHDHGLRRSRYACCVHCLIGYRGQAESARPGARLSC